MMTCSRHFTLIAPSGYPQDPQAVDRALDRLRTEGHTVSNVAAAARRFQRFAGTDSERAADLNQLATCAPLPDIVLAVRGGYGATRILPRLDYEGLRKRLTGAPTMLVGYSDFTAIQMALLARAGLQTFSGPMLCSDFGAKTLSAFTIQHFWQIANAPTATFISAVPQQPPVDVAGTLWGGNLAMIVSLIGTPYLPLIDGGILFLEDINEAPFRIERMLYQLCFAGVMARQQALMLGSFSGYRPGEHDHEYQLPAVVEQIRAIAGIPVVTGLPFGHLDHLLTLPVGAHAHLVADEAGVRLTVSGYPHAG